MSIVTRAAGVATLGALALTAVTGGAASAATPTGPVGSGAAFTGTTSTDVRISTTVGAETTAFPLLSGAGVPGRTVTIAVDDEQVGSVEVNASGAWLFRVPEALTPGRHTVTVQQGASHDTADLHVAAQSRTEIAPDAGFWSVQSDSAGRWNSVQISAAYSFTEIVGSVVSGSETAGLTDQGEVVSWDTARHTNTALRPDTSGLSGDTYSRIAALPRGGYALSATGEVRGWGNQRSILPARYPLVPDPVADQQVVQVSTSAGFGGTLVGTLSSEGEVTVWNHDDIDYASTRPDNSSLEVHTGIFAGEPVVDVAVGWMYNIGVGAVGPDTGVQPYALGLTPDGQILTWGENPATAVPDEVRDKRVVHLETSYQKVWALTDDGYVLSWGSQGFAQESDPCDRVVQLSADLVGQAAVTDDGRVVTWGTGDSFHSMNNGTGGNPLDEVGGRPAARVSATGKGTYVFLATDDGSAAQDQDLAVTIPRCAPEPGEFVWSVEGGDDVVDLGTFADAGDHLRAEGAAKAVRVTDTRAGGLPWSVSAKVGDFVAGDRSFSGRYLGWTPNLVEAGGDVQLGAAVASGFDGGAGLAGTAVLARAAEGHAVGSTVVGADLQLKAPVGLADGTYRAVLTLTALS